MVNERGLHNTGTPDDDVQKLKDQVKHLRAEVQRLKPLPRPAPKRARQVNIKLTEDLDTALEAVRGEKSRAEWCLDVLAPAIWEAYGE